MLSLTVPESYGYVIAVSLGLIPVLGFAHGVIVSGLRKGANVHYPHSYATVEQCEANPAAHKFNCAQRAHANFLENSSQTMLFTLVAGLKYPQLATLLGALWVASRTVYLYGYVYSTQPRGKGRLWGGAFWFLQGALWGLSVFGVAKELL
ncbi:glutathione S-transferase [Aspergillus heteromorphus CBS 117.55]|uniref:Glutathione S-transferase n=1 Tax=Aspergillus heteromorphus CBS 117.55 TaxID=1448321 RepID=A0A317V7W3_9EURO|nr:glutathione S-transferase [Aspergillus heteromorphus CBS 117.55]PWY70454.1 glutathione S-transferase [Aspergillus heteromorphus CBS 117.55]